MTNLAAGEVLFIDEIHRMSPAIEEILYPALEDYEVDIVIGQGPSARTVKMRAGTVHADWRDDAHRPADVAAPVALRHHRTGSSSTRPRTWRRSSAGRQGFSTCRSKRRRRPRSRGGRAARRASPTGCCGACATTRRSGPAAGSRSTSRVAGLKLLEVDDHGFDEVDRKLLRTIIDKFGGGPVGLNTIAAAISEEKDAIEDIYEPFLIQIGFLDRTPRGRVATPRAYDYFGLEQPREGFTTVVSDASTDSASVRRASRAGGRPTTIVSLATYVPPRVLTNADLEKMLDTTDEWIMQRVGIRERHIAGPGVATSDLGREAAVAAIARAGLTPDDIGVIVVGTVTPDMMFPSTACLIQHKIGAHHAWGFDISAACSAFTYSLTTASQLVATGAHEHALVVGADVMSSIIDYTDRSTCVLFGDGAGAVVVSPAKEGEGAILDFEHEIDGSGGAALCMPAGGSLRPPSHETVDQRMHYVKQDGRTVFKFAVRKTEEIARRLLARNGITPVGPRPVRLASGQSSHHHRGRPEPRARRRQGHRSTSSASATRRRRRSRWR